MICLDLVWHYLKEDNDSSIENWAILEDWIKSERFPIHQPSLRRVAEDDPDLLEALRILGPVIGDRGSNPKPTSNTNALSLSTAP
jgi:ribosomal protein L1